MPISLRRASADDAAEMLSIYAPIVRDSPTSFETEPPTLSEMQRRIATTLEYAPWLVCANANRVLGYAYASKHRERVAYQWSVDVSVYIDPAQRRSGIGRALYTMLLQILRLQGFTMPMRASPCPTRPVWACTKRWAFYRWACITMWATKWANGMMWVGGICACSRCPLSPPHRVN